MLEVPARVVVSLGRLEVEMDPVVSFMTLFTRAVTAETALTVSVTREAVWVTLSLPDRRDVACSRFTFVAMVPTVGVTLSFSAKMSVMEPVIPSSLTLPPRHPLDPPLVERELQLARTAETVREVVSLLLALIDLNSPPTFLETVDTLLWLLLVVLSIPLRLESAPLRVPDVTSTLVVTLCTVYPRPLAVLASPATVLLLALTMGLSPARALVSRAEVWLTLLVILLLQLSVRLLSRWVVVTVALTRSATVSKEPETSAAEPLMILAALLIRLCRILSLEWRCPTALPERLSLWQGLVRLVTLFMLPWFRIWFRPI